MLSFRTIITQEELMPFFLVAELCVTQFVRKYIIEFARKMPLPIISFRIPYMYIPSYILLVHKQFVFISISYPI